MGVPRYPPVFESKKNKAMFFKNTTFFYFVFLKQLFYNDSLHEKFLGETTRWFIDPQEELAGALGAFEVETTWVLL